MGIPAARRITVWLAGSLVLILALALIGGPAAAQQQERKPGFKKTAISSLTAEGFEVKAVTTREALIVQKGKDVFWCILRVADTSPMSYQSDCYSIH